MPGIWRLPTQWIMATGGWAARQPEGVALPFCCSRQANEFRQGDHFRKFPGSRILPPEVCRSGNRGQHDDPGLQVNSCRLAGIIAGMTPQTAQTLRGPVRHGSAVQPVGIGGAFRGLLDYLKLEIADIALKAFHLGAGVNGDGGMLEDGAGKFADDPGGVSPRAPGDPAAPPVPPGKGFSPRESRAGPSRPVPGQF